ncbi:MAG: hypothetical protein QOE93_29 [Actinomycetota bacterium]|nr:hypothetical protein [Actinomycetota bacterium]
MGRVRIAGNRGRVLVAGVLALVVAGTLVAALGGLSTDSGDDALSVSRATDAIGSPEYALAPSGGGGASGTSSGVAADESTLKQIGPSPVPPPDSGSTPVPGAPKIVRTGELRVNVGKNGFDVAFDRVASIAAAHGGFVASSSTSSIDKAKAGELTVRIPSDRFDAARRDLAGLGKVEYQALRGEDVSGQLVDYDARLKSLTAQEEALRGLLTRATAVGEVLEVQNSLFNVRQQIEQLSAQKVNLEQSASLATIQISVFEPGAGFEPRPVDDDKGLAHAFERSVDGAVAVIGGMIVVVGWSIPIAVLGLVIWGLTRLFRRRPPTPTPTPTARPDSPVAVTP